jgi:hypothetical protein
MRMPWFLRLVTERAHFADILVQAAFGDFDLQPMRGKLGLDQQLEHLLGEPRVAHLQR